MWISIDGLEASGKSTLVNCLRRKLRSSRLMPEFSKGFAGRALVSALVDQPHYISRSAVAQSLFFLAEFREKVEAARSYIEDDQTLLISDRGILSKVVYQTVVLRPVIGSKATKDLIEACLTGLPLPDLTFCLVVDPFVARARLEQHRAQRVKKRDMEFMEQAASEFEKLGQRFNALFLKAESTPAQTCEIVMGHIRHSLRPQ